MTWLTKTPQRLVSAHLTMLKRLRADESLRAVSVASIGSGRAEARARRARMAQWQREASGGNERAKPATAQQLKGAGIGVRRVNKR